tara:strand:- start:233 stop:364 length:132 start_codon:yes stop_codon:yes gene_type:complete
VVVKVGEILQTHYHLMELVCLEVQAVVEVHKMVHLEEVVILHQ